MAWQSSGINPSTTSPASDITKLTNDLAVLRSVLGGGTDTDVPFNPAGVLWATATGVGIGTSSPSYRVHSVGTTDYQGYFKNSTSITGILIGGVTGGGAVSTDSSGLPMYLQIGGSTKATLDIYGNLCVGVTPSAWSIGGNIELAAGKIFAFGGDGYIAGNVYYNGNWKYKTNAVATMYSQEVGAHKWYIASSGTAGNTITWTQAMLLDQSGNLLLGATAATGYLFSVVAGTAQAALLKGGTSATENTAVWNTGTTGDNKFIAFYTEASATIRGSITYNRGGGLVAYNTTSDYRAKDIIGPVENSGATIDALKVYRGKMKGATIERPMMIAHEAQEVVPYSVTGEKDAENEKGDPILQQMDHVSLVPLLVAEAQSLRARVAALEAAK